MHLRFAKSPEPFSSMTLMPAMSAPMQDIKNDKLHSRQMLARLMHGDELSAA